jgi:hypothetical protein
MRARILSLAADFDRLQRAKGWDSVASDIRLKNLRTCLAELSSEKLDRAERVQASLSER